MSQYCFYDFAEIENGSVSNSEKKSTAGSPVKSPSKSVKSLPRTPETPSSTGGQEKKSKELFLQSNKHSFPKINSQYFSFLIK